MAGHAMGKRRGVEKKTGIDLRGVMDMGSRVDVMCGEGLSRQCCQIDDKKCRWQRKRQGDWEEIALEEGVVVLEEEKVDKISSFSGKDTRWQEKRRMSMVLQYCKIERNTK